MTGARNGRGNVSQRRVVILVTALAITAGPAAAPALAQSQSAGSDPDYEVPRTPDGHPDLQGYWTTQTFTPLERPDHLGEQAFYTDEQMALLQQQLTADGVDPLVGNALHLEDTAERERALQQEHRDETYVHYDNSVWLRTPVPKGLSTRRTSLITSPANGKIPPLNAAGEQRLAKQRAAREGVDPFAGYDTRPLSERCFVWPHEGPPMLPPAYNDIHQVFQTKDHVVIFTELGNNLPRIIPIDDTPFASEAIRMYPGDSRGHWDGDTLVVESKHFTDRTRFRRSSEALRVTERFTRISDETVRYEFTVSDPNTWDEPWSAEIPMHATEGPMWEFACHEGNYDLRHILEIYRNLDLQGQR